MKVIYDKCSSKKATLRITLDAGAAVESGGRWTSGLAHMTEHMMFNGSNTMSHDELSRRMAFLGVEWNAATYHSKVAYYINLPAENLIEAAKMFKDMIFDRKFKQIDLDKEKLVVLEEERGSKDNINSIILTEYNQFLCDGPLTEPILGTKGSIESITLVELQDFYNFYYRPKNMIVTLTSPAAKDYEKIQSIFGNNTNRFKFSDKRPNVAKKTKRKVVRGNVQQARIFVSYDAFTIRHKHSLPLYLFGEFFARDMDSRLFRELRQNNGLCYSVSGWVALYKEIGWYIMCAQCSEENVKKTINLIKKEVEKFIDEGPTKEEMQRAKNKYVSGVYGAIETSYGINYIRTGQIYSGVPTVEDTINRVKRMSSKTIMNACKDVFKSENCRIFTYLPNKNEIK